MNYGREKISDEDRQLLNKILLMQTICTVVIFVQVLVGIALIIILLNIDNGGG